MQTRGGKRRSMIACLAEARQRGLNTGMLCARRVEGEGEGEGGRGATMTRKILLNLSRRATAGARVRGRRRRVMVKG